MKYESKWVISEEPKGYFEINLSRVINSPLKVFSVYFWCPALLQRSSQLTEGWLFLKGMILERG